MKDLPIRLNAQQLLNWIRAESRRQNILRSLLALMLSIFITSCATVRTEGHDAQPKALLDQIWPLKMRSQPSIRPLNKQDQEYAEAALIQWLEAYLHREYEVVDERFAWTDRKYNDWGPTGLGHALYPENENGRWRVVAEIRQAWHDPGLDLVRMWKVNINGGDHYFAIAMTDQPVPGTRGRHLKARFELKKVVE